MKNKIWYLFHSGILSHKIKQSKSLTNFKNKHLKQTNLIHVTRSQPSGFPRGAGAAALGAGGASEGAVKLRFLIWVLVTHICLVREHSSLCTFIIHSFFSVFLDSTLKTKTGNPKRVNHE